MGFGFVLPLCEELERAAVAEEHRRDATQNRIRILKEKNEKLRFFFF